MFVSQIIDEAMEVLGTTDKTKVFRKLTQAVKTLMQSGHYFHLISEIDVCTGWDNQTITLPRGIEVPLAVNVDGSPTYFRNRLFQYSVNKGGMYNPVNWAWDDRGMVSTQMDIRQPSQLVAIAEHEADAGKIIRVVGTDSNNRDLRTQTPDGTGMDGLLVPIHAISDYPLGAIIPDGVTITTRSAAITPLTLFSSTLAHELSSGQSATLMLLSGTIPTGLIAGTKYYIGVNSATQIQLYQNELDAKSGTNPIRVSNITNSLGDTLQLTDSRPSQLYTTLGLPDGLPVMPLDDPNEVTFSKQTAYTHGALLEWTWPANTAGTIISAIYANLSNGGKTVNLMATSYTIPVGAQIFSLINALADSINAKTPTTGWYAGSSDMAENHIMVTGPQNVSIVSFSVTTSGPHPPIFSLAGWLAGNELPSPLVANTTYFLRQPTTGVLQVYAGINDARNEINPVLLTGSSGDFTMYPRKQLAPETKMVFTSAHGYINGDTVQAFTNGGTLPQPLIAGQNYYVHVLDEDPPAVTLHTNYSDALSGTSPINLITAGIGQNSIAKLLQATASPGVKNNISVSGLNLPAVTGGGTVATAQVTGPVTTVTLATTGGGYTAATATLSDVGGYKYSVPPSVLIQGGNPTITATALASIVTDAATNYGFVNNITMTNSGQGYDSANPPTVVFSGGLLSGGVVPNAVPVISRGLPIGDLPSSYILTSGSGWTVGNQLIFADNNGAGTGAIASVKAINGSGGVTSVNIAKSGGGYTNPSVAGILMTPIVLTYTSVGSTTNGSTSKILITTSSNSNGIDVLGGVAVSSVGVATTTALATALATAITSKAASTGFAAAASGANVTITPTLTLTVNAIGAATDKINTLNVTTLSNTTGLTSAAIDLLGSTPITTSQANNVALATAIVAGINAKTSVHNYTASNVSGTSAVITIIPPSGALVNQFYGGVTGTNSLTYSTPVYPLALLPTFSGSPAPTANYAVQPSFNAPLTTTGVVSAINLLPYGTGATMSVSVNSISTQINGVNLTATGSGYLYPPRITISAPNSTYPQIQVTAAGAGGAVINSITAKTKDGATTANLLNANITNSSSPSVAEVVSGLVTQINAKTGTTGYSAYVSPASSDTIVVVPPLGVTVLSFNNANSGTSPYQSLTSIIPSTATAYSQITTSFVTGYTIANSGAGYTAAPAVNISGGGGTGATATAVIDKFGIGNVNVLTGGTGYPNTLTCAITDSNGGTGTGAAANVVVSGGVITAIVVTSHGRGYANPVITFTDPTGSSGWPTTPATFAFTFTGVVTNINVVTEGTGYTSTPTVSIQPSTGVFVQFSSTGTLPAPLVQGNTYRAENPSSGSTFTVKNNDFSDVNITSTGSGTIYLVLSRAFSIGFTGYWAGAFNGFAQSAIRLQTDYQLPLTSPTTDGTTQYYLQKVNNTRANIYTTYQNYTFSGRVTPTQLGVGQAYYAIPTRTYGSVYLNRILPSSVEYLQNGMSVSFTSSSGTLPAPLSPAPASYQIAISGDYVTLKDQFGGDVVFSNLGNSQLSMNVVRVFGPDASESIIVDNCVFETGDAVTVRAVAGDTLPSPLIPSSYASPMTYYVRRIGQNTFELYFTKADAIAKTTPFTPIFYTSTGNTITSTFFVDSIKEPTLVKSVLHVEKPLTIGYVSLYAFDYGRSNDMALIGQYHPAEMNPKYRRIRIGKPCAWVRMAYKPKPTEVQSEQDYVPIENERAIIAAMHAIDLEDKDFMEQAQKYWQLAFGYLRTESENMDGHSMQPPQINNITYGDGTDPVMF